jgi:hypothetical protein
MFGGYVTHLDGDPTNNDPSNLRLVGMRENARASRLTERERDALARLLQRRGLLAVTMALADMTTDEELNEQQTALTSARK